jgi:hypothetical protein
MRVRQRRKHIGWWLAGGFIGTFFVLAALQNVIKREPDWIKEQEEADSGMFRHTVGRYG